MDEYLIIASKQLNLLMWAKKNMKASGIEPVELTLGDVFKGKDGKLKCTLQGKLKNGIPVSGVVEL